MPPRHKIAWLVALGGVLAAWLFLEYRVMNAAQALFDRQSLRVEGVALRPAGASGDGLTSALGEALQPLLPALSACLATPTGTLAPVTLTLSLSTEPAPLTAHWAAASPLSADSERCLTRALSLSPAPAWPLPSAPVEATITLAPLTP